MRNVGIFYVVLVFCTVECSNGSTTLHSELLRQQLTKWFLHFDLSPPFRKPSVIRTPSFQLMREICLLNKDLDWKLASIPRNACKTTLRRSRQAPMNRSRRVYIPKLCHFFHRQRPRSLL